MAYALLALAIVVEVTASLSLRASQGLKKKLWVIPVAAGYGSAFLLMTKILTLGMPIGVTYGIWAASGVALTAVGARVFFRETLNMRMCLGIALIAVGVFVIETGIAAT